MSENNEYMSWQEFDRACKEIVRHIGEKKLWAIQDIYGIPRGGLVVAVRLSHLLDLPLATTVSPDTLIADDICDTGQTLLLYRDNHIVTLYYRKFAIITPDIWIKEKIDRWVVFPWEVH